MIEAKFFIADPPDQVSTTLAALGATGFAQGAAAAIGGSTVPGTLVVLLESTLEALGRMLYGILDAHRLGILTFTVVGPDGVRRVARARLGDGGVEIDRGGGGDEWGTTDEAL